MPDGTQPVSTDNRNHVDILDFLFPLKVGFKRFIDLVLGFVGEVSPIEFCGGGHYILHGIYGEKFNLWCYPKRYWVCDENGELVVTGRFLGGWKKEIKNQKNT